jgi:hypothetical protein
VVRVHLNMAGVASSFSNRRFGRTTIMQRFVAESIARIPGYRATFACSSESAKEYNINVIKGYLSTMEHKPGCCGDLRNITFVVKTNKDSKPTPPAPPRLPSSS